MGSSCKGKRWIFWDAFEMYIRYLVVVFVARVPPRGGCPPPLGGPVSGWPASLAERGVAALAPVAWGWGEAEPRLDWVSSKVACSF